MSIATMAKALPLALASLFTIGADAADIKIGLLEDLTGAFSAAGGPKVRGAQLAVDEINATGGVLGRKLQIVSYDAQSDNRRYQELARRLIQSDKVDVLFGAFSSASREAIRPLVDSSETLYFYNNEYEGGLCDKNTFVTGGVPEQYLSRLIPWAMTTYGKRVYVVAADYNFGQISGEWVAKYVKQNGGEVIGQEYIPLSVSQYGQTIANIQKAHPDFVVTLMIGSNQTSFFEQAAKANLKIPFGSFVNVPVFYEHKQFAPPTLGNMNVTANYVEELDTPANHAFVKKWRQKYPDEKYISQVGQNSYTGILLYAEALKRANSSDRKAVLAALEKEPTCVAAPEGQVCIDPATHHTTHDIKLIRVQPDHTLKIEKTWPAVAAFWLKEAGCNLPVNADRKQYTPASPPQRKAG